MERGKTGNGNPAGFLVSRSAFQYRTELTTQLKSESLSDAISKLRTYHNNTSHLSELMREMNKKNKRHFPTFFIF